MNAGRLPTLTAQHGYPKAKNSIVATKAAIESMRPVPKELRILSSGLDHEIPPLLIRPTEYAAVNALLEGLVMGVTSILGDQAIGAYLHGSLAHGGFDAYSDIDVVVATEADPTNPQLEALQAMHNHLAARDSNWSIQLEVSYLDRKALRRYDPTRSLHLKLNRGRHERLEQVVHDSDWVVVRHTLRDLAWVLFGAHPDSLIEPASPTDLRQAMHALFRSWVTTIPDQPASLQQRGGQSWTVLTLCRMLYTLERGTPVSKREAARWAQEALGEGWEQLIDETWEGRRQPQSTTSPQALKQTLAFAWFALERSRAGDV